VTRELAGIATRAEAPITGTRVVIDVRPLQEPERTPITAAYLARLLEAFAADPLPGESFVPILRTLRPDPTDALEAAGLAVASRRRVPPTARFFRSAGLTLDSFLLRGAEVGTTFRHREGGATGAVYHTAGGAVPLASGLPVVATLLDLAPWELPSIYAASPAAQFGHRLRARILRDATRLIVCSGATAESARRRIHIDPERVRVVRLAAPAEYAPSAGRPDRVAALRARLRLPERYLVFSGRYDARKDLGTLFRALAALRQEVPGADATGARPVRRRSRTKAQPSAGADQGAAASGPDADRRAVAETAGGHDVPSRADVAHDGDAAPWPPVVVLAGSHDDGMGDVPALHRAAERAGVPDLVLLAPGLSRDDLATLEAGSYGFVFPAISEATGTRVIEALATGVPVVASRVGPLPELVGPAGILVEPRDVGRLAAALRAIWAADHIHAQLAHTARTRAEGSRRTWADVARETRVVYAEAAGMPGGSG
jgi:glycosyltransferase involved in cell wall biosynthesis